MKAEKKLGEEAARIFEARLRLCSNASGSRNFMRLSRALELLKERYAYRRSERWIRLCEMLIPWVKPYRPLLQVPLLLEHIVLTA